MANSNKKPYVTSIERARIAEEQDKQAKALLEALRLKHDAARLRLYTGQGLTEEQANERIAQENEQRLAELESEEFEQDLEAEQDQDKFATDDDESDVDSLAECESEYEAVKAIVAAENAKKKSFNNDPNAANRFRQADNCSELWQAVDTIPANIALIPLVDKRPTFKRTLHGNIKDWTKTVAGADNKKEIKQHITGTLSLKKAASHKAHTSRGDYYNLYVSGFGIVTGDASDGVFAIDVDGESANVWLEALSNGDLPHTVEFTSGKLGRRQLLYRVPDHLRGEFKERLAIFTNKSIGEFKDIPSAIGSELPSKYKDYHCSKNNGRFTEALDIRYNKKQSALPPSRHPTTGRYTWINSFQDTPVADMPQWLINLVTHWLDDIEKEAEKVAKSKKDRTEKLELLKTQKQNGTLATQTFDDIDSALAATYIILGRDGVFNWAGHNWKEERSNGWTHGDCPNHESSSGTAFAILDDSGGWKCHGCDASGNIVQYRAWRDTKNARPEGAEWLKYATELFKQAGVRLKSNRKRWENGEIPVEEYLQRELKRQPTEEEINEAAQLKQAKYDALQREYDEHLKRLAINPSKVNKYYTCNERYLSNETVAQFPTIQECVNKGQMLALKAPKGTGKSTRIKELINQAKEDKWLVISVTPRVNLGIAQSADWDIPWISDDNFEQFIQGNANNMSCCWDSLHKLYRRDYRDKKVLFIVDEIESGLEHLSTSGTFKGKGTRAAVYNQLRRLFSHIQQHGGLIIGADADLSRIPLDFIQDVNPGLPITVIDNTYVATKSEVIVFHGKDGDVKSAIREEVECLNPFICACDSKEDVKDLYDHAIKSVKGDVNQKFWAIHADNINDEENQKRIKDFNGRLKEERPLGVFFSPTITVGISIDVPYFSAGFAIFKGSVTTDVARQMVARNREFVEWVTFADNLCDRKSESTPTTPEEVRAKLLQQIKDQANLCEWATEKILKDDRTGFADDEERLKAELQLIQTLKTNVRGLETAEFSLLADVLARQNFQKKHYHQSFVKGMESEGWKVVSKKGNKTSFSDELKEKRELRQKKEAEAIVSADHTLIPDAETAQQILNTSHDKTQRLAAEKVITAEKACTTPDKLDAELTALIKFNPRFRSGVFLEWYLRNHTAAIRRDGAKMAKMVKDLWAYDTHSAIDAIGNSVWINEVIKLGIFDIIDLDSEGKSYKKSDFQPIIDKLKFLSNSKLEMWAQRIDINWNKKNHKRGGLLNNPIGRIIQPILAKLGYSFTQIKKNKKGQNSYAIPAEEINDIYRANIKLALDKKETERLAAAEFQEAEQQGLILKLDGSSSALKKLEVGTVFA